MGRVRHVESRPLFGRLGAFRTQEICVIASYAEIWRLDVFINEGAIGRSERNGLRINQERKKGEHSRWDLEDNGRHTGRYVGTRAFPFFLAVVIVIPAFKTSEFVFSSPLS